MPNFRTRRIRFSRRKLIRSKKTPFKRAVLSIARKSAKAVINARAEHKYLDYLHTQDTIVSGGWSEECVSNLPQGDTDTTRDGDQIKPTTLEIRGALQMPAASAPGISVRVLVAQYHPMVTTTSIEAANILEGSAPSTNDYFTQHYNVDFRQDYTILKDAVFDMSVAGPGSAHFHWKIPLKKKMQYLSSVTDGTQHTNNIKVFWVTNWIGTQQPLIGFRSRLRYIDM